MLKILRRLTGSSGGPATLGSGQLAWNSVDKTLYIGDGDNGSGAATSILPIASGSFASTAYVDGKVSALVNGAGAALDTLSELAAALGNDPNFATTVSTQISGKLAASAVSSWVLANVLGAADAAAVRTAIGAPSTAAATGTTLGLVKGFANLTIDAAGALSLASGNVTAALGFTPAKIDGSNASGTWGISISGSAAQVANTTPSVFGLARLTDASAAAARSGLGLGTAATLDAGTTANKVVQLDGNAKMPAIDGSQLIGTVSSIAFVIDGGGAAITAGVKGDLTIPFACTILEWALLADQSGSIVVDVWKDTYANFPPAAADTVTASAKPTLSAATKGQSSALTGWITSVAAGDVLRFNVDSAATVQRVTLSLKVARA